MPNSNSTDLRRPGFGGLPSLIPVILCIDVEPDSRQLDIVEAANWPGFEQTVEFFNQLRPGLETETGVPANFNWFLRMDPQVEHVYGSPSWVVQRYPALIEALSTAGDEIGLHTHAWRWVASSNRWLVDHGDQAWVEHCVQVSFRAYEESLGHACRSFRFGDRWMNNKTMRLLESLGVEFDLTIEPGIRDSRQIVDGEYVTGSLSDYANVPREPFRPSQDDFRRPAGKSHLNLWSIPLSTGNRLIIKSGPLATVRRAVSTFRWRHQPLTLNLGIDVNEFEFILNSLLADHTTTYLAPVMRTDAASKQSLKTKFRQNVQTLLKHPQAGKFVFVKPKRAMELLTLQEGLPAHSGIVSKARGASAG